MPNKNLIYQQFPDPTVPSYTIDQTCRACAQHFSDNDKLVPIFDYRNATVSVALINEFQLMKIKVSVKTGFLRQPIQMVNFLYSRYRPMTVFRNRYVWNVNSA